MIAVRRRFLFTVAANITRSGITFLTGLMLARWLAPESYGRMVFLIGTFLAVRQILDMGSSNAFFTFMAQRPRTRRFVNRYLAWLGLQLLVPMLVIGLLMPDGWLAHVWQGQPRHLVLLALLAVFMQNSLWPAIQQAGEAQRRTLWVQGVGVAIAAIHLVAVSFLWWVGALGLIAIFLAIAIENLLAAILIRRSLAFAADDPDEPATVRGLARLYLQYCAPFVVYAWVGFAYDFTDRWLLQSFGGSAQQAYYAVSAQFANIALLATASILSIFWKEIAEAHYRGDHERAGVIYLRISRLLFLSGAVIAGFLVPWSAQLLGFLLGDAYTSAAPTLALMLLYPVHQSMGQIGDTMLYATERARLQVGVGIFFMLLSIVATYFLLAPHLGPFAGPQLGAYGVAIKMILLQFLRVNIVMFIICRTWGWRFDWLFQPASLLSCLAIGWLARYFVTLIAPGWPLPFAMAFAGVLYLLLMGAYVAAWPRITGLTREELITEIRNVLRDLRGRSQ